MKKKQVYGVIMKILHGVGAILAVLETVADLLSKRKKFHKKFIDL
jgi:hypothetical protein